MRRPAAIAALVVVCVAGGFAVGHTTADSSGYAGERAVEAFYGAHQPGIEVKRQATGTLVAFDVLPGADATTVGRWMRVWTSDAASLMAGRPIIGDSQPEMASPPARLTVTVGFGYSLFEKVGRTDAWPLSTKAIPAYPIDRLEGSWDGGDVILQVAGDSPQSVFHAVHELGREAVPFARVRWQQRGFVDSAGVNEGQDSRNLLGQIDGTANPKPETRDFADKVWTSAGPNQQGTSMVVRRIRFDLGTWDTLSPLRKGQALGRALTDGAPLSGGGPSASPDFRPAPVASTGIAGDAHARRAHGVAGAAMFRRGWNYDDGYLANGKHDVGLVFTSFQSDVASYLSVQAALAQVDALNKWTTPVGSALFVVPAGVQSGQWFGQQLLWP